MLEIKFSDLLNLTEDNQCQLICPLIIQWCVKNNFNVPSHHQVSNSVCEIISNQFGIWGQSGKMTNLDELVERFPVQTVNFTINGKFDRFKYLEMMTRNNMILELSW